MREAAFTIDGFAFGDGTDYLLTQPVKGLPGGPAIRQSSAYRPQQDGAYAGSGFYGSRDLTFAGLIVNDPGGWDALFELESALTAHLEPKAPVLLEATLAGGRLIQTNVRATSPVTIVERNVSTVADWQAQLVADDPRLYAGGAPSVAAASVASGGGIGLTFPMATPITFGSSPLGGELTANNEGTVDTPWVATFTGPLTNFTLEHVEAGRLLIFDGDLLAGDTLEVDSDTRTVLLNGTASRYDWLRYPRWFALAPGLNTLRVVASVGTGGVTVEWRSAWL